MKKFRFLPLFLMLVLSSAFIYAQEDTNEGDIYYINARIIKVFPHKLGYRVIYRTSGLKTAEAYIPYDWGNPSDGRAVFTIVAPRVNPYITFFMRGGEFDYVKLSLARNPTHYTWGGLSSMQKYDSYFDVETLEPQF